MSKVIEIKSESHLRDILNSHYHLIVLDIYANWCGPCKFLSPKLEELATQYQYSSVLFCKLNQDLQLKQVAGLPTIEFWQRKENSPDRTLVHTVLGANLPEIKQILSSIAQPSQTTFQVRSSAASVLPSDTPQPSSQPLSQPSTFPPQQPLPQPSTFPPQQNFDVPVYSSDKPASNTSDRNNKRKSSYKSFNCM